MGGRIHINYYVMRWLAGLLLGLMFYGISEAQTLPVPEYKIKAVFLYNFTHFIDWPADAFESEYSPFIIGIIGHDPFGTFLEDAIEGERLKTHIIRLEHYTDISEVNKCHILYVGSSNPDDIRRIINAVGRKSILTVSDTPNFIRLGGMVRFFTEENKIRLEINNTLAKTRDLSISSKLLRVATVQ